MKIRLAVFEESTNVHNFRKKKFVILFYHVR